MAGFNTSIEVDLGSQASFAKAEAALNGLDRKVKRAMQNALDEIGDKMQVRFTQEMASFGLGDSLLLATVSIKRYGQRITLTVAGEHMMYVEFGTGIVGQQSPHPAPLFMGGDWAYDINDHGDAGWVYYDEAGAKRWTKGAKAKPVLYNTWRYARRIQKRIFNKHLGKVI